MPERISMKRVLVMSFFFSFLLMNTVTLSSCTDEKPRNENNQDIENNVMTSDEGPITDGDVKNFTLKSTDGKDVSLADYRGKVVLVDFWATWCPPCRKGIPDLVELQKQYGDKFVVIGITLDREKTLKDVVPFVESYKINYPVVYGTDEVVNHFGGVEAIPTAFMLDQNGKVVSKHVGLQPKSVIEEEIKALIN